METKKLTGFSSTPEGSAFGYALDARVAGAQVALAWEQDFVVPAAAHIKAASISLQGAF